MNAVFVIDKPAGVTSHDVVHGARRILQQRDIGHLGTLDPLATGVLVLVTGNLTRLAQFYLGSAKSYEGVVRFGFATDTYDAEGEATTPQSPVDLSLLQIQELAAKFTGVIEQMPPPFSAKKIRGVPAYKLARKHKEVPLKAVQVEVKSFEVLSVELARAGFRAQVSAGTYIRSIAHEMGQALGCGAHLESLRRISQAEFDLAQAHTLEELASAADNGAVEDIAIHPRELLPQFPSVTANDEIISHIRCGRAVNLPNLSQAKYVKVFRGQRDLIAIATRVAGTLFHPKVVLISGQPAEARL